MTANPLRDDFETLVLTNENVHPGPWPAAQTPAAVLSNPDELKPAKKPRKKKSATGRKRGRPASKAKAPAEQPVTETKPEPKIAPSGEGVWPMLRRVGVDPWLVLAVIAIVCLGLASVGAFRMLTGAW